MPQHSETRVLPFSADQMYALVGDVAHYPKFLPWTAAARIRDTKDHGDHLVMLADLVISFKVFRETFGSKVTLWPATKRIDTAILWTRTAQLMALPSLSIMDALQNAAGERRSLDAAPPAS